MKNTSLDLVNFFSDALFATLVVNKETNKIESVNDIACEYYGYIKEDLLHVKLESIFVSKITEEEVYPNFIHQRKDRKRFRAQMMKMSLEDNWVLYLVKNDDEKILKTEIYEKEIDLFFNSNRKNIFNYDIVRSIFSLMPNILYLKDSNLRYIFFNSNFYKYFGFGQIEIIGKTTEEIFPEDFARQVETSDKEAILEKKTIESEQLLIIDGVEVWLNAFKTPILDNEGNFIGLLGGAVDITKDKEHEKELSSINQMLNEKLAEREELLMKSLDMLSFALECRDPYTSGHQKRVAELSVAIAKKMEFSEEECFGLKLASLIHDIGKIGIPAELLSKPTKLSAVEFELIKNHSTLGAEIVSKLPNPWNLSLIVEQHHERYDGTGYPKKLIKEEINIFARILAVADSFEAIVSHRPYRPGRVKDFAIKEIANGRNTLYDPKVVDVFMELILKDNFEFEQE